MDIKTWLENFKEYWQSHNIGGVLSLFDKNVIYYETPFIKLENFDELSRVWGSIKNQNNTYLDFEIFSSCGNKHSVIWKLKYEKKDIEQNFSGTYLIELNDEGLCTYFHHSCEAK